MNEKEKRFQKDLVKRLKHYYLNCIEISDLMHPNGKPDLLILSHNKYLYTELKVDDHRKDFMLRTLFNGRPLQLPYYYEFLISTEWRLYVIIKLNKGYEVMRMTRKLVKAILAGLKYSELATKFYLNSNFVTNKDDLCLFLKEEIIK